MSIGYRHGLHTFVIEAVNPLQSDLRTIYRGVLQVVQ
jgi:hypothetical protein